MSVRVPHDFTPAYQDYAIYLPSLQKSYAQFPLRPARAKDPPGFDPNDLDFLSGNSRLWTFKASLYSAGHFTKAIIDPPDIVSRNRGRGTTIVGDSGGYQVATGKFPVPKHFAALKGKPGLIIDAWKSDTRVMDTVLRWLDLNCDYAMTLDMPPRIAHEKQLGSTFTGLSVDQLLDLSLFNLTYFAENRGRVGGKKTKLLNVLHEVGGRSGDDWYNAVTRFQFEGWAFGSGTKKDLASILQWTKRLLRDGHLDGAEWIHILAASPPRSSVLLTAIQCRLHEILGTNIRVSYDSSSPYLSGGRFERFAVQPRLTDKLKSWVMRFEEFPQSPKYVDAAEPTWLPTPSSPIFEIYTVNDLHRAGEVFGPKNLTQAGVQMIINHNLYVAHRAAIEACDLVFHPERRDLSRVPRAIKDNIDLINRTLK